MKLFAKILLVLILIDMIGCALWILSGQKPADGVYVGTITSHAVGLLGWSNQPQ